MKKNVTFLKIVFTLIFVVHAYGIVQARLNGNLGVSKIYAQSRSDTIILNSEYLVPMGPVKPLITPVNQPHGQSGIDPVNFRIQWTSGSAEKAVAGGWESILWWLRNLNTATINMKIISVKGDPVITFRFYQRHIGVGTKNDYWEKNISLKSLLSSDTAAWKKINLDSTSMTFKPLGAGNPNWHHVNYMTVTFQGRMDAISDLIMESPLLHLQGGKTLRLWDAERDLSQFDGGKVQNKIAPGEGAYLIGKGGSLLGDSMGRALLLDLKKIVPQIGIAANGGTKYLSEQAGWLNAHKIAAVYQQGGVFGLSETISKNRDWLTDPNGVSRNTQPGAYGMVGLLKYYDMTSPVVYKGFTEAFEKTSNSGISEFQVIESYWPFVGGFWGGGINTLSRLRSALNSTDGGLDWHSPSGIKRMSFWDYFNYYNGFILTPEEIGLSTWSHFSTPTIHNLSEATSDIQRKHFFLMMNLTRYEAIKFYGIISTSAASKGIKLATIINRENYDNSFDLLGLVAQKNLKVIGHEYFGNPGNYLNQSFDNGSVLQQLSAASKTEIRGVVETNATGTSGRPYLDPQIAFAAALASWAADKPKSVENDWLTWYPKDIIIGHSTIERERYADFVIKGLAFNMVKQQNWKVLSPDSSFGVIKSRSINNVGGGLGAYLKLLRNEAWPRQYFDLSEARYLGKELKTGHILFGEWDSCSSEDIAWLKSWLADTPDQTLIICGYRLGKNPNGANYVASQPTTFKKINSQYGFLKLLGSKVIRIDSLKGKIASSWLKNGVFPANAAIPSYYQVKKVGIPLVTINGLPLVSMFKLNNGSKVIYIHYDPSDATSDLDKAILHQLASEAGIQPEFQGAEGLILRKFKSDHSTMIAAFDQNWINSFKFRYDPLANLRMKWKWEGNSHKILVEATEKRKYIINMLTGEISDIKKGNVDLYLKDVGCGIWIITDQEIVAKDFKSKFQDLLPFFSGNFKTSFDE